MAEIGESGGFGNAKFLWLVYLVVGVFFLVFFS